jgi:hypothetical protein
MTKTCPRCGAVMRSYVAAFMYECPSDGTLWTKEQLFYGQTEEPYAGPWTPPGR